MKYTHKVWPDSRCWSCGCKIPTDDRGYCQRCNEGWDKFYTDEYIATLSHDTLQRERELIRYAYDTAEARNQMHAIFPLIDVLKKVEKRLLET